jgi:hypothetical protein
VKTLSGRSSGRMTTPHPVVCIPRSPARGNFMYLWGAALRIAHIPSYDGLNLVNDDLPTELEKRKTKCYKNGDEQRAESKSFITTISSPVLQQFIIYTRTCRTNTLASVSPHYPLILVLPLIYYHTVLTPTSLPPSLVDSQHCQRHSRLSALFSSGILHRHSGV